MRAVDLSSIDFNNLSQEHLLAGGAILGEQLCTSRNHSSTLPTHLSLSTPPAPRPQPFGPAVSVLGLAAVAATTTIEPGSMGDAATAAAGEAAEELPPPLPREDAVLVFGGTGKLGRRIVEKVRGCVAQNLLQYRREYVGWVGWECIVQRPGQTHWAAQLAGSQAGSAVALRRSRWTKDTMTPTQPLYPAAEPGQHLR